MAHPLEFAVFALPTFFPERDGPQGPYMRKFVDFLASAEDLGYDGVWANEHHFHPYGGFIPSPPVMLSALAQRTQRVSVNHHVPAPKHAEAHHAAARCR